MFPFSTTAEPSHAACKRPRRAVHPCHVICCSRVTGSPQAAEGRPKRSFRRSRLRGRFHSQGRLTALPVKLEIGAMQGVAMHGLDGVSGEIERTVDNVGSPKITANGENPL